MEYCGPIGLPHSRFLSWDPDDQDKAMAWVFHKASRCSQCGTFPEEWLDGDGMPVYPPPYMAGSEICLGCETLDAERKLLPSGKESQYRMHLKPWRHEGPAPEFE